MQEHTTQGGTFKEHMKKRVEEGYAPGLREPGSIFKQNLYDYNNYKSKEGMYLK